MIRGAAAMQHVTDWLEKLGLGQYAQRFAENDIDFALLTKLTDADLKELGVTSLGHRKRLLEGGKWVEKAEIGAPGEYDALSDEELERQIMERVARFERGSDTQHDEGETQH
jgi:SAM domain (Sterile alpha motif)